MVFIYPQQIQTSTGHSISYATQKITNPNNLCSNSTSLAYWGVKNPTYYGIYMRNYPDSVTSASGSYHTPETIYATNWDIQDIPDNAIITNLTIQYKWEQISYSCGTSDCYGKFDKPTISLTIKGKTITTFKGAKPEAIRYDNNTTNQSKMNTNNAELSVLHSHPIKNIDKYNLTMADLKKMKIKFKPAKNTATNHCRIIMQFLRVKIEYKKVEKAPVFRIINSSINPEESKLKDGVSEPYTYTCTIKSSTTTKPTTCTILPLQDDIIIDPNSVECVPNTNTYNTTNNIWTVNSFSNNQATITFQAASKQIGTKEIKTTINQYADSIKKEEINSVNIIETPNNVEWNVGFVNEKEQESYLFDNKDGTLRKCLRVTIERDQDQDDRNEKITIDTQGWITNVNQWHFWSDAGTQTIPTEKSTGVWEFSNIKGTKIQITTEQNGVCPLLPSGEYRITVTHSEKNKFSETKTITAYVADDGLPMDYFRLQLQDGSDVRYNSLIFTTGDDLDIPLTYDIAEDNIDYISINGETKHIPVNEARYVTYTLKSSIDIESALCQISMVDMETGDDCSDILISADSQVTLKNGENQKFCIIDKLVADEEKKLKFIVQSSEEKSCLFKLKFLNYDEYENGKWTPAYIYFKDMPNIKLSIETDIDDLTTPDNDIVEVKYIIENKSMTTGENLKFRIKEPPSFNIIGNPKYTIYAKNTQQVAILPYFNERSRTIIFPDELVGATFDEATNSFQTQEYVLKITYEATKKGIYDFTLYTYDDDTTDEDDQWENSVTKKVMVDISSNTLIKTSVSKQRPYVNELIDFTINVKNYIKKQNHFKFIIKDIGSYDFNHPNNDYLLEYHTCTNGEVSTDVTQNQIGVWDIDNININDENELVLSLRPQELGYHVIETTFIDSDNQIQQFENVVNVLERNKQISFNAYHAISTSELANCNNCDLLTEICDNDFINLGDELYYVCEIKNNNHNTIETMTHLYARVDDTILENGILCSSHAYEINENNLIHIKIPQITGCSSVKVCFKIIPSKPGTFISNFMLTNRNSRVYHKDLTINVDEEFYQRKMEHEITIYNFEKTNRYFRYELDGNNNIFKFYNQGNDRTLRPIDVEEYNKSGIEKYKGTNLKKIVRDITNNSKYVEPELLHIGSNKFKPKGYELYPDGFIRRFGLLNSEVFHYTGQLPIISHLADKAMRWEIDPWDLKVWGGGIYDNGVFDLAIDYSKVPTNFNILELDNPVNNLQTLVDKVKPYGTKAICYYYAKLYLDLNINLDLNDFEVNTSYNLPLKISDNLGLISLYHRHDNSLAAYYDLIHHKLNTDINTITSVTMSEVKNPRTNELQSKPFNNFNLNADLNLISEVYDQHYIKKYISECFDIVQNIYAYNSIAQNIDIIKTFNYNGNRSRQSSFELNTNDIYIFEFNDEMNCDLFIDQDKYQIKYVQDVLEKFNGCIISNDKDLFKTNFYTDIQKIYLQLHICNYENKNIIHMFCSINEQDFVHIGYLVANQNQKIMITPNHIAFKRLFNEDKVFFRVRDTVQTTIEDIDTVVQFNSKNKWNNLSNIKTEKGYASIENNYDVSIECEEKKMKVPILALKYNNINITDNDEIVDIGLQFKAKTNKPNFTNDININMYKNGDTYIPENNTARTIYYPNQIDNVNDKYINDITIQQPNITICSTCMKTALGIYDTCPYCGSTNVSNYDEKKAVTICRNPDCGWITDGWHDYCPHCLSQDIEKTKVDFNKTVCSKGHISDDYYPACPICFNKDIVHLNNDEKKFSIHGKDSQNIDKVIIKSNVNRVNLCNIELNNDMLKEGIQNLEYLQLHLYGTNYNSGKFYYCSNCNQAGLGNTTKCQFCNSQEIQNFNFDNTTMDIYYQSGSYIKKLDTDTTYDQLSGEFDIAIDIVDLVQQTNTPKFKLLIYAENLLYDDAIFAIEKIKTEVSELVYNTLVSNVVSMNLSLDNIYYDYKYNYEKEWEGLENIQKNDHTGIRYVVNQDNDTKYIQFSNFGIKNDKYKHVYVNVAGINKADQNIDLNIEVVDQDNNTYTQTIQNIKPDIFSTQIDILDFINKKRIENLQVKIKFSNVDRASEIIITHCYITTEKEQKKNILHTEMLENNYNIQYENDTYFINTKNLFNLNNSTPFYLDGKQLDTNLVCYLDLGQLSNNEYIRLYNVKMVVLYKNRYGKISTEYINVDDSKYTKQLINGHMQKNNAEIFGSVKTSLNILNNLEYQIINNNNERSLQSTPLTYELMQAFSINTGNISQISLNYNGHIGYPSDVITLQIYDDYQNYPDHLLFEKEIVMPMYSEVINIDIGLDNLDSGQYWIKLIDHSANKNNYHRFYHNNNTNVGNLIIVDNEEKRDENIVLSFNIDSDINFRQYYNLPTSLDLDSVNDFKTYHTFYRYNTKSINNAYLSDLKIETGYIDYNESIIDDVEDITTEDDNDEA